MLKEKDFTNKELLFTIEKKIDSLRTNNTTDTNLEIVISDDTKYQTLITILDLFRQKKSMIYAVHQNIIFWIHRKKE